MNSHISDIEKVIDVFFESANILIEITDDPISYYDKRNVNWTLSIDNKFLTYYDTDLKKEMQEYVVNISTHENIVFISVSYDENFGGCLVFRECNCIKTSPLKNDIKKTNHNQLE